MKRYLSLTIATLVIASLISPTQATAASKGWRYWGYYQAEPGATKWTTSMTGPSTNVIDGSVEGWAFTFSNDDTPDADAPRKAPNFNTICAKTKAATGKKRVGLYVDFGYAALKPKGEKLPTNVTTCVLIDSKALGVDVLAAATKIRAASSGFICGINSYPAKECGEEISTPLRYTRK